MTLQGLLSPSGQESAGRFGFLYSVILSNTILWYVWLFACIWTRTLVDIPDGVYMAYGIANGMAFAGKGIQSFGEILSQYSGQPDDNL